MAIAMCGLLAAVAGCATPEEQPVGAPSGSSDPSATAVPARSPTHQSGERSLSSPTLIEFVQLSSVDAGNVAGEVTRPEQLDRFLTGSPTDQQIRDAAQRHRGAGVRLFAFVLDGCQNDGASLVIEPARVYATLTGGVDVQCLVAEHYLAVFAVPAAMVPDRARIG